MANEPKTKPTNESVPDFIARQPNEQTRRDCATLVKMMKRVTGAPARMWGPSIVGVDRYPALVKQLGKARTSKACLYLKSLADVDLAVLEELVAESVAHMRTLDPAGATAEGATAKVATKMKAAPRADGAAKRTVRK
jgi:hypothetical protein